MMRDAGLEAILHDEIGSLDGVTDKPMFGGWAWLLGGNLLCGARRDGMLVRLGKGNDAWALAAQGIEPMISRGRHMHGWVRARGEIWGDDAQRAKLLAAAIAYVRTLPVK